MPDEFLEQQLDRIEGKVDQLLARAATPAPVPAPTPAPAPAAWYPSGLIPTLAGWTIMRPTGPQGKPDNGYVKNADVPGIYYVDPAAGAVVFRCPPDGVHSEGSKYPRSEGREMADSKGTKAAWSSSSPRALVADLAIDTSHLRTRKRISGVQIHDAEDDVLQVIADERGRLGVAHNDGDAFEVLREGYAGERFTCRVVVTPGEKFDVVRVEVDSVGVDLLKHGTGWYWKIGCYLQTGGASTYREPAGTYGEVRVWSLRVG